MGEIKKNYVAIHVHTDDSLLDSCTKFSEYVDIALANGQKAIATTEHGMHRGYISKKLLCDEKEIKLLIGVEIYLTESLEEKVRDNYHTVLIAKNEAGLRELNALVSKSTDKNHFYYNNRISFDEFLSISDNIIKVSACLASPLNKLADDHPRYLELARKYDYLEVQPHLHPDQYNYNKRLSRLADIVKKPLICGTDTHSSTAYKAECRAVLTEAKGKYYDDDAFDLVYKTYDELVDMFKKQGALKESEYLAALENTNILADSVEEIRLDTSIKYPILYGSREKDSEVFTEMVYRKLDEKLESGVIPRSQEKAFRDAIEEEMRVFRKLKMDGFMLSMSELICWCKEQGMAIGTARGSVGGSRVAYVSDIIDLNPETWNTVFSRFCNEDRTEIGDIDIDCVESDRPAIFQYITNRFGQDYVARVASYGTIKEKGVIDDVGRCLAGRWSRENPDHPKDKNPYSLKVIEKVKNLFDKDPDKTKATYPEIFYYMDGLLNTKVSQSVHPAGMVISPVTLNDNYGVFLKDGEYCLLMDMEEVHDGCGLAKYDFLVLKTVQVIRDTCRYIGIPYPKTHEIDWEDESVWDDMLKSPNAIFQMEGSFAFDCLRKFAPKNIFDMSIVTACIRPSGSSYRNDLLQRKLHKNPSEIIDNLLKDNLGYLIYQEDTIKFLQQICGLSGSEADNIRRAIGRKQKDRLDAAMPSILEGYCKKSSNPREIAEQEAKEFLQIIEDSASYQFGYNHSIAYCLLGYLCAYFRYYYPVEFITAFLNNAANSDDIENGTELASEKGITISMPKFGYSKGEYSYNKEERVIAKGIGSIKYLSDNAATELFDLAQGNNYEYFCDLICDIRNNTGVDTRQTDILIKLNFFQRFGNERLLLLINDLADSLKYGAAKKLSKETVSSDILLSELSDVIRANSNGKNKDGSESKSFTLNDAMQLMRSCEEYLRKNAKAPNYTVKEKMAIQEEYLGYVDLVTGNEEDRKSLYVTDVYPLISKATGKAWGYAVFTKSIGSGKSGRWTIRSNQFSKNEFKKGAIVRANTYHKDEKSGYWYLDSYTVIER